MCVAGITFVNFSGTKELTYVTATLNICTCLTDETGFAFCAAVTKLMSYEEKRLL
jgi:hypothetical protein